jgi:hypothetical protein
MTNKFKNIYFENGDIYKRIKFLELEGIITLEEF